MDETPTTPHTPVPKCLQTLKALVLRVMHTNFDHIQPRTFRGDIENIKVYNKQTDDGRTDCDRKRLLEPLAEVSSNLYSCWQSC